MKNIPSFERIILRELFKTNESIDIFSFHEKYRLSPAQILSFLEKYSKDDLIQFSQNYLKLSDKGKIFVWKNRFGLFAQNIKRSWRPLSAPLNWKETSVTKLPKINYENLAPQLKHIDKKAIHRNDKER